MCACACVISSNRGVEREKKGVEKPSGKHKDEPHGARVCFCLCGKEKLGRIGGVT
uniref:Uncharacterized protein n=1 Tax=Octopus bimaculoides TaxID=37653 RepID=A0A0L8HK41_OCTBM